MDKPAARVSDPTACPIPGHGTNPIAAGSPDVIIEGLAAAYMAVSDNRLRRPGNAGELAKYGVWDR